VSFNDSGLSASLNYLREKSAENWRKLISETGNRLAYSHHLWASSPSVPSIEKFWSVQLSNIVWSPELERNIKEIKAYLLKQEEVKWLGEVLRYLPEGHVFNATVYLNLGYDNIVLGEDVALNLHSHPFSVDNREAVYYLIHELAHAGYVRYHPLPELYTAKTNRELLNIIEFLTHLEGMGVMSAMRLRLSEGGLLDNDYKVLLNDADKTDRLRQYFSIFDKIASEPDKEIGEDDFQVFEVMSAKETRLWYIAGCHMALEIEKHYGIEMLRELVKQGSQAFLGTYLKIQS
jgi:hypothetical protein